MKRLHYLLALLTFLLLIVSTEFMKNPIEEGFSVSNIIINTCPLGTQSIQTAKGNTDCCSGDMIDGKCNGKTVCTNSPVHDDIPTCADYWRKEFEANQKKFCPKALPNYYEDVLNPKNEKGCSKSPTRKDGSQPEDAKMEKCIVYSDEKQSLTKQNSCFLQKERLEIKCPVLDDGQKASPAYYIVNGEVRGYNCNYARITDPGLPYECFDDRTYTRFVNKYNPSQKNSLESMRINRFCSTLNERRKNIRDERRRREEEERKRKDVVEQLKKVKGFFGGLFRKVGINWF